MHLRSPLPAQTSRRAASKGFVLLTSLILCTVASPAWATVINTTNVSDYLLVGLGRQAVVGTSTAVSNFELGANSSSVPMSGLSGSVPPLPGNALPVFVGVGGNGDVAIPNGNGNFDVSNIEIWGDSGIDCAGGIGSCNTGNSNSDFNGSNLSNANGLNGGVDLSALVNELATAQATLPSLVGDHSISLNFNDGKWDNDLVINLLSGLTVIDIATNGNDLLLENTNLLFNGSENSSALVRIPDEANFLVSQSNIVVGNGGIGLTNVLFYTDKPDNNQHVKVNDAILNGVSFWDLGDAGGEITFNNVQGCMQAVGDKINLNNVRLNQCGFAVPEPGSGLYLGVGLLLSAAGGAGGRRKGAAPRD